MTSYTLLSFFLHISFLFTFFFFFFHFSMMLSLLSFFKFYFFLLSSIMGFLPTSLFQIKLRRHIDSISLRVELLKNNIILQDFLAHFSFYTLKFLHLRLYTYRGIIFYDLPLHVLVCLIAKYSVPPPFAFNPREISTSVTPHQPKLFAVGAKAVSSNASSIKFWNDRGTLTPLNNTLLRGLKTIGCTYNDGIGYIGPLAHLQKFFITLKFFCESVS